MSTKDERVRGGGPWQFTGPALDPGDSWVLDFRNMEHNGTKGYFKKWMPFDVAQVTNPSNEYVEAHYNGQFTDTVVPNAVETFEDQAVTYVRIHALASNTGTIAEGDIRVSVKKEPYGADDAARENREKPWLQRAADEIVPGGLPGGI